MLSIPKSQKYSFEQNIHFKNKYVPNEGRKKRRIFGVLIEIELKFENQLSMHGNVWKWNNIE